MGEETDLRKFLNGLIVTLFGQIVENHPRRQKTELVPVLSSEEDRPQLSQAPRINLRPFRKVFVKITRVKSLSLT